MEDALPHGRREGPVHMCQHARPQLAPGSRKFRHHRVNAVCRGPGHQPDDELGGMFRLALNLHGMKLEKAARADKPYLAFRDNSLLLRRWCDVLVN